MFGAAVLFTGRISQSGLSGFARPLEIFATESDFRHRLAVSTLLRWYRDGVDVERHLPELSTYLGHGDVSATYSYLTATPELLRYALLRAEQSRSEPRP